MPFANLGWPIRLTAWFLFLSYLVGGSAIAVLEFSSGLLSERFGYPAGFIYLVGTTQFFCSLLLAPRRVALMSLAVLTAISLGAVASHVRIDSPLTGLPALGYTGLQIWMALSLYRSSR